MKKIMFPRFARAMIGMAGVDQAPASARSTVLRLVGSHMRFKAGRGKSTLAATVMIMLISVLFPRLASATPVLSFLFGTPNNTSQAYNYKDADMTSFSSAIQQPTVYSFKITAQASADGTILYDGDVEYDIDYKVPYFFNRQVVLDQSGPVTTATFPVVNRVFQVEAAADAILNPNNITSYDSMHADQLAAAWPITVTGTGLTETKVTDNPVVDPI